MSMLSTLRSIRGAMVSSSGASDAGASSSTREVEALKKENERLKVVTEKQRYRIELLVGNLKKTSAVGDA